MYIRKISVLALSVFVLAACNKKDDPVTDNFDTSGTFITTDMMARPVTNTVFVGAARKNEFNTTPPSQMEAAFKTDFVNKLTGFGYTNNILGLDKNALATVLVKDVLGVKTNGVTTFFDGTNVLTGRALADDVIDVDLTLIFGGATGTANPGLSKDNVAANDKAFLSSFPFLATPH